MQKKVLCPVDFFHDSFAAESIACKISHFLDSNIVFLHIEESEMKLNQFSNFTNYALRNDGLQANLKKVAHNKLVAHIESIERNIQVPKSRELHIISGYASDEILKYLGDFRKNIEIIVLAKKKRSFLHDFFLGSVAQDILNSSLHPVFLVPDDSRYENWTPEKICFATSLKTNDREGMQWSAYLSKKFGASLDILHVEEPLQSLVSAEVPADYYYYSELEELRKKQSDELLSEKMKSIETKTTNIKGILLVGSPHSTISKYILEQKNALLVMETHQHKKSAGRLAHAIARSAAFPVLFVPQQV